MEDFDRHPDDRDVKKGREKAEEGNRKSLERWLFF